MREVFIKPQQDAITSLRNSANLLVGDGFSGDFRVSPTTTALIRDNRDPEGRRYTQVVLRDDRVFTEGEGHTAFTTRAATIYHTVLPGQEEKSHSMKYDLQVLRNPDAASTSFTIGETLIPVKEADDVVAAATADFEEISQLLSRVRIDDRVDSWGRTQEETASYSPLVQALHAQTERLLSFIPAEARQNVEYGSGVRFDDGSSRRVKIYRRSNRDREQVTYIEFTGDSYMDDNGAHRTDVEQFVLNRGQESVYLHHIEDVYTRGGDSYRTTSPVQARFAALRSEDEVEALTTSLARLQEFQMGSIPELE